MLYRFSGYFKALPLVISVLLAFVSSSAYAVSSETSEIKWICSDVDGQCKRVDTSYKDSVTYPTVELCRLVCGEAGAIWPIPTHVRFTDRRYMAINPESVIIRINPESNTTSTNELIQAFRNDLSEECTNCHNHRDTKVSININLSSNNRHLDLSKDESYGLTVNAVSDSSVIVNISVKNISGLGHSLQTLSQLIASYPESDNSSCLALVRGIQIDDQE